jgi:signal peptidase I
MINKKMFGVKQISFLFILTVLFFLIINTLAFEDLGLTSATISSPGEWVKDEQILVYNDKVILDIPNATWVGFTDTKSMEPFFDHKSNALEIKPQSPDEIIIGDIISYQGKTGVIIHRVIEKNVDNEGIYFVVKGDNNKVKDQQKVRFEDIKGVVVAVIY